MTPQHAAAFAVSAQAAALSNYGKLVGSAYPPLSAYRYAPYPLPTAAAQHQASGTAMQHLQPSHAAAVAAAAAASQSHHHQQQQQQIAGIAVSTAAQAAAPQALTAANGQHAHAHHAAVQQQHAIPHAVSAMSASVSQSPAVLTSPSTLQHPFTPVAPTIASPYQGYSLANVDMSGFQGIDWTAMYNVGMYA